MEGGYFFHAHTHMAGTGAVPLFPVFIGFSDDKAKHNDPRWMKGRLLEVLTALAQAVTQGQTGGCPKGED